MKCRDFQVESDLQPEGLSEPAQLHLGECADCQKFQSDQTRLLEMLGGLEPVDVPKDFNVQVRARIARGRPESPSVFIPALRYVLPLVIVLAVVSFVAVNTLYFVDPGSPVVQSNPSDSVEKPVDDIALQEESIPVLEGQTDNTVAVSAENENPAVVRELTAGQTKNNSNSGGIRDIGPTAEPDVLRDSGGGSQVLSVSPGREVITPLGINTNTQNLAVPPTMNPRTFTVTEVLSLIGIELTTDDENRRVKSVTQNSPAERSGVRTGDVIEEIDGKPLIGENLRERSFQGNKLTVRRADKRLEIVIGTH